jgi:hypothetical protein
VVITAVDRSRFTTLPGTVALETTIGQPVAGVADRYLAEGFEVEIVDPDIQGAMTADLRPNRIRLLVHDGVIVDASQC